MSIQKFKFGFTLVELLIVISLVGTLAAGVAVVLNPTAQLNKANDAKRKSDLKQIQNALEIYYNDNRSYPANSASNRIMSGAGQVNWGQSWAPYISSLPQDPNSAKRYIYVSTGQSYFLYANLDQGGSDPQACFTNGSACTNALANSVGNKCGGACNYGVTSSNTTP